MAPYSIPTFTCICVHCIMAVVDSPLFTCLVYHSMADSEALAPGWPRTTVAPDGSKTRQDSAPVPCQSDSPPASHAVQTKEPATDIGTCIYENFTPEYSCMCTIGRVLIASICKL